MEILIRRHGLNAIKYLFLVIVICDLYSSVVASQSSKSDGNSVEEQEYGVRYADDCEVCKYVSLELEEQLKETDDRSEMIETGYDRFNDDSKKRTSYKRSELRLIETVESVCERLMGYNVHKERTDSTRFARGTSQTFKTLHGLVDRGVKVDLGIPFELWDKPSAEITHLKTQCEKFIEKYEPAVELWYWEHQDIPLAEYLCEQRALKNKDTKCLYERFDPDSALTSSNVKQEL